MPELPELGVTLGRSLKGFREIYGLNVPQMARALRRVRGCHVNPSMIYRWESGKTKPQARHVQRVALAMIRLHKRFARRYEE